MMTPVNATARRGIAARVQPTAKPVAAAPARETTADPKFSNERFPAKKGAFKFSQHFLEAFGIERLEAELKDKNVKTKAHAQITAQVRSALEGLSEGREVRLDVLKELSARLPNVSALATVVNNLEKVKSRQDRIATKLQGLDSYATDSRAKDRVSVLREAYILAAADLLEKNEFARQWRLSNRTQLSAPPIPATPTSTAGIKRKQDSKVSAPEGVRSGRETSPKAPNFTALAKRAAKLGSELAVVVGTTLTGLGSVAIISAVSLASIAAWTVSAAFTSAKGIFSRITTTFKDLRSNSKEQRREEPKNSEDAIGLKIRPENRPMAIAKTVTKTPKQKRVYPTIKGDREIFLKGALEVDVFQPLRDLPVSAEVKARLLKAIRRNIEPQIASESTSVTELHTLHDLLLEETRLAIENERLEDALILARLAPKANGSGYRQEISGLPGDTKKYLNPVFGLEFLRSQMLAW